MERDSSDIHVVVEFSTNEREDDLYNAFNEDGLHIGDVKVDINPITAQRTGKKQKGAGTTGRKSILKIAAC